MRIALIPSSFAPRKGGVEVLTASLGIALQDLGDEVEIWTPVPDAQGQFSDGVVDRLTVRRVAMELPPFNARAVAGFPAAAVKTMRTLRDAVRRFRPDVLHVQCFSVNGAYATVLSRIEKTPLIVSLQGETFMDDQDIYVRSIQLRLALRLGLRQSGAVTACSRFTFEDAAARFGAPRDRFELVHNGVDLTGEGSLCGDEPTERYLLGLGRFVRNKGFDLLLLAFARVHASHPDVRLILAGDGEARSDAEALARTLGVSDSVDFRGAVARDEVRTLMAHAEVVVVPSRREPFGIVVLEAWNARRPVVASSNGGIPEFLRDGRDGLLVDPEDTRALADALIRLLDDQQLASDLAASGAARVKSFAWPVIAAQYREIYARTCDEPHP